METRCAVPYWLHLSEPTTTREKIGAYNVMPDHRGVFCQFPKAELQQLNRTQFPSLGIFISENVQNRKN